MISIGDHTFIRLASSVLLAASDDISRPQLCTVLVRQRDKHHTLVATDGCWLAKITSLAIEGDDGEIAIRVESVREMVRMAKAGKIGAERYLTIDPSTNTAAFPSGATLKLETWDVTRMVPWESVIPAPNTRTSGAFQTLDPTRLAKVCKAFDLARESNKKSPSIFCEAGETQSDPIVFSSKDSELVCVLGPIGQEKGDIGRPSSRQKKVSAA
jgi:hypothetical protein